MPGTFHMASGFTVQLLSESLQRLVPDSRVARYCVAFSGGVDSTALLHALAKLRSEQPEMVVRAAHVNHHLMPQADEWADHCRKFAERMSVPLVVLDVAVRLERGESREAAARAARYAALAEALAPQEYLLTAHQRDDQLETLLLQLMRGAGVAGLAAMPECVAFAGGMLLRPLLAVDRTDLLAYCRSAKLPWIDDPSNDDLRFDRNFMRQRVVPLLRERWAGAAASVARSARHLAEAQSLLDQRAAEDLALARDGENLRISALRALAPARARNLLRYWIDRADCPVPPTAILEQALSQMLTARPDAMPLVEWSSFQLRRFRDGLYLCRPLPELPPQALTWNWREHPELELPTGLGRLRLQPARAGAPGLRVPPTALRVAWTHDAQRLQLSARGSRRALRNLFQEYGVVPWMRPCLPLLFVGDSLAAVADLWIDARFHGRDDEPGMTIEWLDHPPIF